MSENSNRMSEISEQIRAKKQEVRFSTREYVAEYLIEKLRQEEFFVPFEYQRNFVWTGKTAATSLNRFL